MSSWRKTIRCPGCGKEYDVEEDKYGRQTRITRCACPLKFTGTVTRTFVQVRTFEVEAKDWEDAQDQVRTAASTYSWEESGEDTHNERIDVEEEK